MTYLTKALLDNPHLKACEIILGLCPDEFGLEDSPCDAVISGIDPTREVCKECWEREMPV